MSTNSTILSQNIRYLRKKSKMSQGELATKLGIKRSNIAAYESKSVEPRLRIVLELAKLFDVSVKALIDTPLDDTVSALPFKNETSTAGNEASLRTTDSDVQEVKHFVDKTMKIRKILEGFKSFYLFKKSNIDTSVEGNEKLVFDIDNFIQLMEHLLAYNETVIKAISNRSISQQEEIA